MAFDFKKEYKDLYLPKEKPMMINIPKMKFIMIDGKGDPNTSKDYADALQLLYGISYTIKMSKLGNEKIDGYFDYVVPPLEGLWNSDGPYNKDKNTLIWTSMIRLPDFVNDKIFKWSKEKLKAKHPMYDVDRVYYKEWEEGLCAQIMHKGSYDDEPRSFEVLNAFIDSEEYERKDFKEYHHHEIYLTDPRKCAPEKNRTVLRVPLKKR